MERAITFIFAITATTMQFVLKRLAIFKVLSAFFGVMMLAALAHSSEIGSHPRADKNGGPIADRLAIRELIESYNAAVIENDAEAWGVNWSEDGLWNLGEGQEIVGREAIVKHWQEAMEVFSFVGMFAQPKFIYIDRDAAYAHWHTNELAKKSNGEMMRFIGLYKDVYRREANGWKILERRYEILLFEKPVYKSNDTKEWR